jgi:hypothetical protein
MSEPNETTAALSLDRAREELAQYEMLMEHAKVIGDGIWSTSDKERRDRLRQAIYEVLDFPPESSQGVPLEY